MSAFKVDTLIKVLQKQQMINQGAEPGTFQTHPASVVSLCVCARENVFPHVTYILLRCVHF